MKLVLEESSSSRTKTRTNIPVNWYEIIAASSLYSECQSKLMQERAMTPLTLVYPVWQLHGLRTVIYVTYDAT